MPDAPIRTRFAPSPTGRLHLGNLRIAVFNALFARRHGGQFVLRVEDTDTDRNLDGSVEGILEDLAWAGLVPDEGPGIGGAYGPYVQSLRAPDHGAAAMRLLEEGAAYRCFCTPEELEAAREAQRSRGSGSRSEPAAGSGIEPGPMSGPGCPGGCRDAHPDEADERARGGKPHTVRFRTPDSAIRVEDAIRGEVRFEGRDVGDFVLLRADGRATYNLAVVVDDAHMEISHVIRGDGHLSNTPKHLLLFRALGAPEPVFAHLPVVLSPEGGRLSKRSGSPGVDVLRRDGHLPRAVVNYLSLLGWSPGGDRELLEFRELVEEIDLERTGASPTTWDPAKLRWMTTEHLRRLSGEELARDVEPFLRRAGVTVPPARLLPSVERVRPRLELLSDAPEELRHLWPGVEVLRGGWEEVAGDGDDARRAIQVIRKALSSFEPWDSASLGQEVRRVGGEAGFRGRSLFHPLRLALSGRRSGPDLGDVLEGIGRDEALRRLSGPPEGPEEDITGGGRV